MRSKLGEEWNPQRPLLRSIASRTAGADPSMGEAPLLVE